MVTRHEDDPNFPIYGLPKTLDDIKFLVDNYEYEVVEYLTNKGWEIR